MTSWEVATIIGSIGFAILIYLQYREAVNPFIKEVLKGLFILSPLMLLFSLAKIEEDQYLSLVGGDPASSLFALGEFYKKMLVMYGSYVFVVILIFLFALIMKFIIKMKNGRF